MTTDPKNPFLFCANLFNTLPKHYSLKNIMDIARLFISEGKQNQFDINARTAKRLKEEGADSHSYLYREKNYDNKTILISFLGNAQKIEEKDFPFIRLLIGAGADLSLEDDDEDQKSHVLARLFQYNRPLDHYLARTYHQEFGSEAFSAFIAKHGILHKAAKSSDQAFIQLCVEELGVDINLKNSDGETPVMHIIHGLTCDFLMQYAVDWNAKDNLGKSVLVHFGGKEGDEGQKLYKRLYTALSSGAEQPLELKESVGGSVIEAIKQGKNIDALKQILKYYDGKPEEIRDTEENNLLQVSLKHGRWAFYNYLKNNFSFEKRHKNVYEQNTLHTFVRYGLSNTTGDPSGKRRSEVLWDVIARNPIFDQTGYTIRDCVMESIHANSFLNSHGFDFIFAREKNQDFPMWVQLLSQHVKDSERPEFLKVAAQYGLGEKQSHIHPLENLLDMNDKRRRAILSITRLLSWKNDAPSEKTFDLIASNLFEPNFFKDERHGVNEYSAESMTLCILSFSEKKPDWWTNSKKNILMDGIVDAIKSHTIQEEGDSRPTLYGDEKLLALVASLVVDNTDIPEEKFTFINNWGQRIIREKIAYAYDTKIAEKWEENFQHWKYGVFDSGLRKIAGNNMIAKAKSKI